MEVKELVRGMCSAVSITGYEYMAQGEYEKIFRGLPKSSFDEFWFDNMGNCHIVKTADKRVDKPIKILLDAHIDQIGMMVCEICDGGFVRVSSLGGIDVNILLGSHVYIYTSPEDCGFAFDPEKKILGVVCNTPPHLKAFSSGNLPEMREVLIDTGYSKEELQKIVRIGAPVSFKSDFCELKNDLIACSGLDDRICGAIIVEAIRRLKNHSADVHGLLSVCEETGGMGAKTGSATAKPDIAIVFDVGFSRDPDVDGNFSFEMGKGAGVSYSASTSMNLTRQFVNLAKQKELPLQIDAEPTGTGTNAATIQIAQDGIPCICMSLPLKNMHGYYEVASMKDIETSVNLLVEFIMNMENFILDNGKKIGGNYGL